MNKIVSLVIFTLALAWTWNIIHTSPAVGSETHSGIQEKLGLLIQQTVMAKKPGAKNFQITRLWTETVSDTKVRAVFSYTFSEDAEEGESTQQIIDGEAVLFREPRDQTNLDRWTLQSVKTTNDAVTFNEGIVVTPDEEAPQGQIVDPDPGLAVPNQPSVEKSLPASPPTSSPSPTPAATEVTH